MKPNGWDITWGDQVDPRAVAPDKRRRRSQIDASRALRAYAATLRWFPFSGVFYLGTGVGFQVDCEALISEVQEGHEPAAAQ